MADGLQNTFFLLRDDGFLVAKLQPDTASGLQEGQLPSVLEVSDDVVAWITPIRTKFISEGSSQPGGKNISYSLIGLAVAELDFTGSLRTARMGESLLLTGGILGCYDGEGVVELGFHTFPENASVVVDDTAGGDMEAGVRSICFLWEWYNAKGQREQSAPSVPIQFTTAGGASGVTATVPSLRLTAKRAPRTNPVLVAYSTEVDGNVYYRTPDEAGDVVGDPVYNDPDADTVTFTRTVADSSLLANELLYTSDGILENVAPPTSDLIAASRDRVFVVDAEDRRKVWVSKRIVKDEAIAFSDDLFFYVSPEGGDILAIDVMDDKTVLFKADRIEVVSGEGPDEAGQNDSLSPAILVTTDVGCSSPDSLAPTPDGLVFQSKKGIYRLSRGMQSEYVGAPVQEFNDLSIVATVLEAETNEVRFLTSDPGGRALVWNYLANEWSTDIYHHPAVDGGLHGNAFVWVDTNGIVHEETPGTYLDGTQKIPLRIQTAWLKLAGIQGYQRVRSARFLGEFFRSHRMRVKVAYDYKDFAQEYRTWDPGNALSAPKFGIGTFGAESPFGGVQDRVYQFVVPLARQKCQAVRFDLVDLEGGGESYSLTSIALEVGIKSGGFRLPASKIVS